jgi:hypothetical protein
MPGKSPISVAIVASLSSAAAFAVDPPAPAPRPQLICRGGGRSLGSHIPRARRCRTAEQWRQEDDVRDRVPLSVQLIPGQNDGRSTPRPQ